jgi:hypothetical protein
VAVRDAVGEAVGELVEVEEGELVAVLLALGVALGASVEVEVGVTIAVAVDEALGLTVIRMASMVAVFGKTGVPGCAQPATSNINPTPSQRSRRS